MQTTDGDIDDPPHPTNSIVSLGAMVFDVAYLLGALVTTWAYMEKAKPGSATSDLIMSIGVATWPLTWAWALCMLAAESRNKRRARRRP